MRLTIELPVGLCERLLAVASLIDVSVDSVVDAALRSHLTPQIPTFSSSGLAPGVDLTDMSAVLDLMDEGVPLHKLR